MSQNCCKLFPERQTFEIYMVFGGIWKLKLLLLFLNVQGRQISKNDHYKYKNVFQFSLGLSVVNAFPIGGLNVFFGLFPYMRQIMLYIFFDVDY